MKIKSKPFKPKMPRHEEVIFVQDAAIYYQLCNDRWQLQQEWLAAQKLADYYQSIWNGIRGLHHETSD